VAEKNLVRTLSRSERQALIEWNEMGLPVSQQADLLALQRSTLSYQPVPPSAKEVALKHRIAAIYTDTPVYGYRRITAQLHQEGWEVERKTVARYMREMRLAEGDAKSPLLELWGWKRRRSSDLYLLVIERSLVRVVHFTQEIKKGRLCAKHSSTASIRPKNKNV